MIVDKACFERGCACYDDRVDGPGVEVVEKTEKQEPVAWLYEAEYSGGTYSGNYFEWRVTPNKPDTHGARKIKPLYTTPQPQRAWVDLTRKEFAEILCDDRWQGRPELMLLQAQQQLKEKNQ